MSVVEDLLGESDCGHRLWANPRGYARWMIASLSSVSVRPLCFAMPKWARNCSVLPPVIKEATVITSSNALGRTNTPYDRDFQPVVKASCVGSMSEWTANELSKLAVWSAMSSSKNRTRASVERTIVRMALARVLSRPAVTALVGPRLAPSVWPGCRASRFGTAGQRRGGRVFCRCRGPRSRAR